MNASKKLAPCDVRHHVQELLDRGNQYCQSGTSPPSSSKPRRPGAPKALITPAGGHGYVTLPTAAATLGLSEPEMKSLLAGTVEIAAPLRASSTTEVLAGGNNGHLLKLPVYGGVTARHVAAYAKTLGLAKWEVDQQIADERKDGAPSPTAARIARRHQRSVNILNRHVQTHAMAAPLVSTMRVNGEAVLPVEVVNRLANTIASGKGDGEVVQINAPDAAQWDAFGDAPQSREKLGRHVTLAQWREVLVAETGMTPFEIRAYEKKVVELIGSNTDYVRSIAHKALTASLSKTPKGKAGLKRISPFNGNLDLALDAIEALVLRRVYLKYHQFAARNGAQVRSWLYPIVVGVSADYISSIKPRRGSGFRTHPDDPRAQVRSVTAEEDDSGEVIVHEIAAAPLEVPDVALSYNVQSVMAGLPTRLVKTWDAIQVQVAQAWEARKAWERGTSRRKAPFPPGRVNIAAIARALGVTDKTARKYLAEIKFALTNALGVDWVEQWVGDWMSTAKAKAVIDATAWQHAVPGKATGSKRFAYKTDFWDKGAAKAKPEEVKTLVVGPPPYRRASSPAKVAKCVQPGCKGKGRCDLADEKPASFLHRLSQSSEGHLFVSAETRAYAEKFTPHDHPYASGPLPQTVPSVSVGGVGLASAPRVASCASLLSDQDILQRKRAAAIRLANASEKTQRDTRKGLAELDRVAQKRHLWSPHRPIEGGGSPVIVEDHEDAYAETLDKDERKAFRADRRAVAKREAAQMADWSGFEEDEEEALAKVDEGQM